MKRDGFRILIVDDDVLACEALRLSLVEANMKVVGTVHNGRDAVGLLEGLAPDVVVWDDSMPDMDGIGALGLISETHPSLPVMIMTGGGKPIRAIDALAAGAFCIVDKRKLDLRLLPDMIRVLARSRGAIIEAELLRASIGSTYDVDNQHQWKFDDTDLPQRVSDDLSIREFGILQLIVSNHDDEQIAAELSLDITAVRADLKSICRKLQVEDVSSLGRVAARLGLIDEGGDNSRGRH